MPWNFLFLHCWPPTGLPSSWCGGMALLPLVGCLDKIALFFS